MAPFTREELNRLDWSLFQNGWVSMYWRRSFLEEDCAWLADHGYRVYSVNCEDWKSATEALEELGKLLEFPDYYGGNLDAFNDCLSDLTVADRGGTAIALFRYDRFLALDPTAGHAILDILATNSRRFMLFGQRLVTLIQTDDPALVVSPVGATPVMWNRREWTNDKRVP
jgi:hypothetical protein